MAVAGNPVGRQSADLMKSGKAKVYGRRILNGVPVGRFRDFGNIETATITVETESTSVRTGEDDLPTPVKTSTRITSATLGMTARNHNQDVEAISFQGEFEDYLQPAVANAVHREEGVINDRDYIKLPHEVVNVASVKDGGDGAAAVPYVLNTNYKVDGDAGGVFIVAKPETAGEDLVITYSAEEHTVPQIGGFSISNGILYELLIRETAEGPKGQYFINRARITPDGDQTIIAADSDDPVTREMTITLEQDETKAANYGLFTYRKLKGSL